MTGRLTISLAALAENYSRLNRCATGGVAAVVKANAYGLGLGPVAKAMWQHGCRDYFVATCAEGIELRGQLHDARIYVLSGVLSTTVTDLRTHHLKPVINTLAQAKTWSEGGGTAAVHVDTGMQRLGLPIDDVDALLDQCNFDIDLFMTHLACADDVGAQNSAAQIARFTPLCDRLRERFPGIRTSVTNSAGLCQSFGPEQLGRAGIALYGGNPFTGQDNPQVPVIKLEGCVLQVRQVEAGVAVGYGASHTTSNATQIATVGVGYADGVPRLLSNCGRVFWHGQYFPIVGRVSMDTIQLDVGQPTPQSNLREGDWVEVMGPHITVDEVAEHAATIGYEILTGLGRRAPRQYIDSLLAD